MMFATELTLTLTLTLIITITITLNPNDGGGDINYRQSSIKQIHERLLLIGLDLVLATRVLPSYRIYWLFVTIFINGFRGQMMTCCGSCFYPRYMPSDQTVRFFFSDEHRYHSFHPTLNMNDLMALIMPWTLLRTPRGGYNTKFLNQYSLRYPAEGLL